MCRGAVERKKKKKKCVLYIYREKFLSTYMNAIYAHGDIHISIKFRRQATKQRETATEEYHTISDRGKKSTKKNAELNIFFRRDNDKQKKKHGRQEEFFFFKCVHECARK